jgi:hypothetical protein
MEHMTPEQLLTIVVGTLAIILIKTLWEWRMPIADRLRPMLQRRAPASRAADYVAHGDREIDRNDRRFSAPNRAEPALFVPPVQLPPGAELPPLDIVRLDTLARLMAAGTVSESAAITVVWDGTKGAIKVSKGGSKAYADRRDALRLLAAAYGWKAPEPAAPPEPPRVVKVNAGRPDEREVPLQMEPAP